MRSRFDHRAEQIEEVTKHVLAELPWLIRLDFEVPVDPSMPMDEETNFIMENREWFEQYKKQMRDEGRVGILTQLFAMRLGRPLSETEGAVVSERLRELGDKRVSSVLLALSTDALAAWLVDPAAH